MHRFLRAISLAAFFWTFWFVSCLGIYVGTFTEGMAEPQCRYVTARGFFDEVKENAIVKHSMHKQWCPATLIFQRDKNVQVKTASYRGWKLP